MVIVTAKFEPLPGHQAALEPVLERMGAAYGRHGTTVQLFSPLVGRMMAYLAVFQFDSVTAYAQWRETMQGDADFQAAMADFSGHIDAASWETALYQAVDTAG
ncbi:MAG: hypothetical protein M0Z53_15705 [Thermaerobacter sp.]|nr:hypothetical protein [Thermaerobacter sp.]